MKKQYIAPQVQAMSVVTIGSVMTTSIVTPPDMGAPARNTEVF